MATRPTRRQWLGGATAAMAAAAWTAPRRLEAAASTPGDPFRYCLNTGTVRGQKLSLKQQIEVAADAGYDALEPWISDIDKYQKDGGSLDDMKKLAADRNVKIVSAIGFAQWIVDDDAQRAKGLEQARHDMALVKRIGGTHLAAPPAGATNEPGLNLFAAAERYHALLEVGREAGVIPQVEVWGFSKNLSRLGEAVFVAVEAGHPDACVLPDVYHVYKGGSDAAGLKLLSNQSMHCFHINDYPADPPRETIKDEHRVFPGDGVAPLDRIFSDLAASGCTSYLSLELFNRDYWKRPALEMVTEGLVKSKASVKKALKL